VTITLRHTTHFSLRVLDYAAEGYLEAYQVDNLWNRARSPQSIPLNYRRFWNTADPDSDAYTVWEEYRGFMYVDSVNHSVLHRRLDTLATEAYFRDQDHEIREGFAGRLEGMVLARLYDLGVGAGSFAYPFPDLGGVRCFLDYESHYWMNDDWVANPLCTPQGLEELPRHGDGSPLIWAHQGLIRVVSSVDAPRRGSSWVLGDTRHQVWIQQIPFIDTLLYRGPAGDAGITIYRGSINQILDDWYLNNGLTLTQKPIVDDTLTGRTIAHEIGHALGIFDHSPDPYGGCYECVMKYDSVVPDNSAEWAEWIARGVGVGYGFTTNDTVFCGYGCHTKRGLRPRGPTFP
jgi:hypothetical protein